MVIINKLKSYYKVKKLSKSSKNLKSLKKSIKAIGLAESRILTFDTKPVFTKY